jgi:hypothetical protein
LSRATRTAKVKESISAVREAPFMFDRSAPGLTLYELDRALKAVQPAVLLVPPRILRRVIRGDQPGDLGLIVPHRKAYRIAGSRLLEIADAEELGLGRGEKPPDTSILLETPDPQLLADMPRRLVMLRYWRMLFHMEVHQALERKQLNDADLRQRLDTIGAVAFTEVRAVLRREGYLLTPDDDRSVYTELAAVYLDFFHFDPRGWPFYFPALAHAADVADMLEADVGARDLFQQTRLRGSADPMQPHPNAPAPPGPLRKIARGAADHAEADELTRKAEAASAVGNNVRAALLHARAAHHRSNENLAAAAAEIDTLLARLGPALGVKPGGMAEPRPLLLALLPLATDGIWPVEARLLYDLQKVCIDHERDLYAVDLVEYLISFGKRPLQRPLPGHQAVLVLKHLSSALNRLPSTRLADEQRLHAAALLQDAIHRCEERLRNQFRPILTSAFDDVGLVAHNYPEHVSRLKLVEELLDKICEHGFVTVGDLRDAVSRNRVKLADLSGPGEFFLGDCLICLNRRLAVSLDGVYRPGEIYLRWLQRLSSTAFGTPVGRFLTRYAVLPFGGAYMVLKAAQEIAHISVRLFEAAEGGEHHHLSSFTTPTSVFIVGIWLFALLHWSAFRERSLDVALATGRSLRWLFFELPDAVLRLPLLQRLFASPAFQWCKQWVLKPLGWSAPVIALVPLAGGNITATTSIGVGLYLLMAITLNTRLGRALEETCSDWLFRTWKQIEGDIIPGLFWLIVAVFKQLLNLSEQLLYTVDEWLRFRKGESRLAYWVKLSAGVVWFFVTYIFRICINLMVEPTINPIKHFPVVTVAAKMILPFIKPMGVAITLLLAPVIGVLLGGLVAGAIIFFLPGLAGFLVWELKENWRLYQANRAKELRPVLVGHHGETVVRLLRPGIHSGTLPKVFAKLRKAWRGARVSGQWRTFRKHREALHGVEHSVHEFVEREFLQMLHGSRSWGGAGIEIEAVVLWTNRIAVDLACPSAGAGCVRVGWTLEAGMLVGAVLDVGWLPGLRPEQRQAFALALAGQHRLAGVHVVAEQLAVRGCGLSDARAEGILYSEASLPWDGWVAAWQQDQAGEGLGTEFVKNLVVLPRMDERAMETPGIREG